MTDLPQLALSVRQPWAWAIVHAGKDIENRTGRAISFFSSPRKRPLAIHAAKGMTRDEYQEAFDFIAALGIACPRPAALQRGGIIGRVDVVDIVKAHASRWFFGPWGLVLANPQSCEFIAAIGALGYFAWKRSIAPIIPSARWMLRCNAISKSGATNAAPDLFDKGDRE